MSDSQALEGPRIRLNPLLMQKHFIYDRQAPLVEIEKVLEFEGLSRGFFSTTFYSSRLAAAPNYTIVQARLHRRVGRGYFYYPTGSVKATLWENPTGHVYIEGIAQAEGISFYGWMILMLILGFFALVGSSMWGILPLVVVLGLTLFFIMEFYQDRNTALELVHRGFSSVTKLKNDDSL